MRVDIGPGDDTCPKNAKNESALQSPARAYLTIGGETSGFDLALTGDEMSLDATALVAHARLDASDIPVETPPQIPPVHCEDRKEYQSSRYRTQRLERFTCVRLRIRYHPE